MALKLCAAAMIVLTALSASQIVYSPTGTAVAAGEEGVVVSIVSLGTDVSGYDIVIAPPGSGAGAPQGYSAANYMGSGVLLHLLLNPAPVHVEEASGPPGNRCGVSRVLRAGNKMVIEYGAYDDEINPMAFRSVRLGIELLLDPVAAAAAGNAEPAPLPAIPGGPRMSLFADIVEWINSARPMAMELIRRGMLGAGAVYDNESGEWVYRGRPVRITYVAYPWSPPYTGIHTYVSSRLRAAGFHVDMVNASVIDYLDVMTRDPGEHSWHIVAVPLELTAYDEERLIPMFYASWNHTSLGGAARPAVGMVYWNKSIDDAVEKHGSAVGVNRTSLLREIVLMGVMDAVAIPLAYLPTRIYYRPGALPEETAWQHLFTPWSPGSLAGKKIAVVTGGSFTGRWISFSPLREAYSEPYLQILYSATVSPPIYRDPGYMAPAPLSLGDAIVYELTEDAEAYLPVPQRLRWRPVTVEKGAVAVRAVDPAGLANPVDGNDAALLYARLLISIFLAYTAGQRPGATDTTTRLLGVEIDPNGGAATFYFAPGTGEEDALLAAEKYLSPAPLPLGVLAYSLSLALNGYPIASMNYLSPSLAQGFLDNAENLAAEGYTRYYWVIAPLGVPVVNETAWAEAVESARSWVQGHGCLWAGNGAFYIAGINSTTAVLRQNPFYRPPRSPPIVVRTGDFEAGLVARRERGLLYPFLLVKPRITPSPTVRSRYYILYAPMWRGWPRGTGVQEIHGSTEYMIPLNSSLPFDEVVVIMAVEAWSGVLHEQRLLVEPSVEIEAALNQSIYCPGTCSVNVSLVTGGAPYMLRAGLYSYPDASVLVESIAYTRIPTIYYGVVVELDINASGLPENMYMLRAWLEDSRGAVAEDKAAVLADTEPPALTVNVENTGRGLNVVWTARDLGGIRAIVLHINGSGVDTTKYFYGGGSKVYSGNHTTVLGPGNYTITVTAYDEANHTATEIIHAMVPEKPLPTRLAPGFPYIVAALLGLAAAALLYAALSRRRRS